MVIFLLFLVKNSFCQFATHFWKKYMVQRFEGKTFFVWARVDVMLCEKP